MSNKEAVVFILDASPSMLTPYPAPSPDAKNDPPNPTPNETPPPTRLSCAKEALEGMLCDLILKSKTNEVGVIILKTEQTRHHLCCEKRISNGMMEEEVPFRNLTELGDSIEAVSRPTVELLREVRRVRPFLPSAKGSVVRGDFCDGIVLAADALHRRTVGKKFRRRLVLFTDAAHEVRVDLDQMGLMVRGLRNLDCGLTVIGLDFTRSARFDRPTKDDGDDVQTEDDGDSPDDTKTHERNADGDRNDSDDTNKSTFIKSENEKLLISLARLTGGSVIAASTMHQLVSSTRGKRIPVSMKRKMILNIAPDLAVDARFSLLTSKATLPSLKRQVVLLDDTGTTLKNGLGENMTSDIVANTTHLDPETLEEVTMIKRTQAFKYGADLIPIGGFDLEGLKIRSPVSMTVLGYTSISNIPRSEFIGQPYAVTGGESQRACAAISALARGMHALDQGAICTFVKSKDADPVMGVLLPLATESDSLPRRLFYIQMPFADDVSKITMPSLDNIDDREKEICDDLIASLMLPNDALCSHRIPNPSIRCLNKTVMSRAIDPNCSLVQVPGRGRNVPTNVIDGDVDPMSTPPFVLKQCRGNVERFLSIHPLKKVKPGRQDGKGSSTKRRFWSDVD